jgi:hypothetical protein
MRFVFPREVLLVEVGRWCREPACGARVRLSLTKKQARSFTGFECERCGRWYWDTLSPGDIPEWWEEFHGTSPEGLTPELGSRRPAPENAGAVEKVVEREAAGEPERRPVAKPAWGAAEERGGEDVGEVVERLSEAWRRMGGRRETKPAAAEPEREGPF